MGELRSKVVRSKVVSSYGVKELSQMYCCSVANVLVNS